MSDPVDKLAAVLGSLSDMRATSQTMDNAALAERLTALSEAYLEMQHEIAGQARELAALRDQVRLMADELESE